jgi:hypothetical protein
VQDECLRTSRASSLRRATLALQRTFSTTIARIQHRRLALVHTSSALPLHPCRRQLLVRDRLDRALELMSRAPLGKGPAHHTDDRDGADADRRIVECLRRHGVKSRQ